MMNNSQVLTPIKNEGKDLGNGGFKIVEINVTDPSENLFAVCTPVKK